MKKKQLFLFLIFYSTALFAKESFVLQRFLDKITIQAGAYQSGNQQVELVLQGNIKKTWHIYSIKKNPNFPLYTKIKFLDTRWQTLSFIESEPLEIYDALANTILAVHKNVFEFRQKVAWQGTATMPIDISMALLFQICNQKICSLEQKINLNVSIE